MDGMNGKSAKISGPRPLPSTFFSLLHSSIRRFIVWTNEQREMDADYSGGQSSPWAVAPRGRKECLSLLTSNISSERSLGFTLTLLPVSVYIQFHDIFSHVTLPILLIGLYLPIQWPLQLFIVLTCHWCFNIDLFICLCLSGENVKVSFLPHRFLFCPSLTVTPRVINSTYTSK
jgi:hypothetical protein